MAVNTTTGTGAEGTAFAIINDEKWKYKLILVVPGVAPSVGLNDPVFMRLQPPHLVAWTGMDAFCHAMEPFVGRLNMPVVHGVELQFGHSSLARQFHTHRNRIPSFMSRRFAYGTSEALLQKKHGSRDHRPLPLGVRCGLSGKGSAAGFSIFPVHISAEIDSLQLWGQGVPEAGQLLHLPGVFAVLGINGYQDISIVAEKLATNF